SYYFKNQLSSGSQVKTSTLTGEMKKNSCGSSQAQTRLKGIHISFVWSIREVNWTLPLLLHLHYITEKSILVMIDPRPSVVPGDKDYPSEDCEC
ncbi:hypothetical protein HAX54_007312, partial [Datura stramonium]|nr:hypothetical protein [Datura stramonium]